MDQSPPTLQVQLNPNQVYRFFPLLQQGVAVTARVGCDIQSLLCDQFGLLPDYVTDRINTIFLNGKPVDEVKSAIVNDGATLALSAAMPGLVGATFRKSGCLASFRGSITYRGTEEGPAACFDGSVTLKLFNLLLSEMGPLVLARGIWIDGVQLRDLFDGCEEGVDGVVGQVRKDGRELSRQQIRALDWLAPETRYFLQVVLNS